VNRRISPFGGNKAAVDDVKARVKQFLATSFRHHEFQDDEDIFASGFVNSLFAMQLVNFVEDTFSITVENEELELDNFRSVEAIARLVQGKAA
jgi:methoxymalonate biosynthesis acyl carrier protein